jgi:hypothetical protein
VVSVADGSTVSLGACPAGVSVAGAAVLKTRVGTGLPVQAALSNPTNNKMDK